MNRHLWLALVVGSTLSGSLLTLLIAEQAQATPGSPEAKSCSVPSVSASIAPAPITPEMSALAPSLGAQPHTRNNVLVTMVSTDQAVLEQENTEQGTTEQAIDEDAVMDFTAAESDAAVALFGCDCPACMRVLNQLQSQAFSQVLLSSNQGHCWNALRQQSPQETQEVLRGLEAAETHE